MSTQSILSERSQDSCELCQSKESLEVFPLAPDFQETPEKSVLLCQVCKNYIENPSPESSRHWHCLNQSIWSEFLPVQILSWRILSSLSGEPWAQDLLEQMYLDDEALAWAKSGVAEEDEDEIICKDSNGTRLLDGDSVTLIKDLNVKGAGFTAKRGTLVKNISLTSNPEQIEGRVNGTQIVLLTCFLKKA